MADLTSPELTARIHRGAREIGGSCVELRSGDATIILDLGTPLTSRPGQLTPLPQAIGLGAGGTAPLGVFITHGHQDHWGLVPQLPPGIPLFVGQGAANVLRAAQFWGTGVDLGETGHLTHLGPVRLGPFTVTPYLPDHSGYDAYSLLVEAGGRRLFYTGDLRGHGRKAAMFDRLLAGPPAPVHALLMEGTSFRAAQLPGAGPSAQKTPTPVPTEADLENSIAETMRGTDGLVVVLASAQNIDRLVTVYRSALRAERDLVVDLYTADVAAATGRASIPRPGPDWPRVHVHVPLRQRVRVKDSGEFGRVARVREHRLYAEQLRSRRSGLVLFGAYQSEIPRLLREGLLEGGAVVWSMWDGYLHEASGLRLQAALRGADVPLVHHHTSGHASTQDLAQLVAALHPRVVVPIHTDAPDEYAAAIGPLVQARADGVWWPV